MLSALESLKSILKLRLLFSASLWLALLAAGFVRAARVGIGAGERFRNLRCSFARLDKTASYLRFFFFMVD